MNARASRNTVRFRITALAVATVTVVAIAGSITLVELQRSAFEQSLEEATPPDEVEGTPAEVFEDADEATATLESTLAIGVPIVIVVLGALVWWLVGRTLRPVEEIRSEVALFGDGRWDQRVPEPGTGDEIDRLAATMNEMLGRLERSAERQRRFVGDASHELRSPLTRLRTQIEVAHDDPTVDSRATLRQTLDELVELSALVEDLLALARIDEGRAMDVAEVDIDVMVTQVISPHREADGVMIDGTGIEAARAVGDERLLRRAIDNLVRNGVRHATSVLRVSTTESGTDAVIEVLDDGPGVPVADRERVFERFTRLDDARSRGDGGSGLGLAICREVVERHGGTVTISDAPDGGARFTVRLPRI